MTGLRQNAAISVPTRSKRSHLLLILLVFHLRVDLLNGWSSVFVPDNVVISGWTATSSSRGGLCRLAVTKGRAEDGARHKKKDQFVEVAASEAMERAKAQLARMSPSLLSTKTKSPSTTRKPKEVKVTIGGGGICDKEELYRSYMVRSANELKVLLKERRLKVSGRKPDLASRLVENDLRPVALSSSEAHVEEWKGAASSQNPSSSSLGTNGGRSLLERFASVPLSTRSSEALAAARIRYPTPIQEAALPVLYGGGHAILHGETGSGKTLAYLLPLIERMTALDDEMTDGAVLLLLTPTLELAGQVAGVAEVLAPPGTVRLVGNPSDLSRDHDDGQSDRRTAIRGRIIVGSARCILHSLFGDGKVAAPPTPKPAARVFLQSVRYLVLDEVDRLLGVGGKSRRQQQKQQKYDHEKPAALLTAAIVRETLSAVQIVSCSATVGRPLRRELSRVLGLPGKEGPLVVRGADSSETTTTRAVTVPSSVRHYVLPCDDSVGKGGTATHGAMLTAAASVARVLNNSNGQGQGRGRGRRILLVLATSCGISVSSAVGALKHLRAHPRPRSLRDALHETDHDEDDSNQRYGVIDGYTVHSHRRVTRASGVGYGDDRNESSDTNGDNGSGNGNGNDDDGYLLVTGEDSVRGLHLDRLDVVLVVGRPIGPDEYTHVAGRTGRAGASGSVVNMVSYSQARALSGWESMLGIHFTPLYGAKDLLPFMAEAKEREETQDINTMEIS